MSNLWIWATVAAAFCQALRYAGLKTLNQSLSTGAEELHWWVLERFDWRLEAEAGLRKLLRR